MIKISIITIVKNKVDEIEKTIKSVLRQDYQNIQYIVVDGYSTDGTYKKILKYKKKIKIIRSNNKNLYGALNKGIDNAKGEYIGHLNGGDVYSSKKIISTLLKKKTKRADFFFSNLLIINQKKRVLREWSFKLKKISKTNFFKIAHPTLFINQKIKKKYRYDEKYDISSDFLYLLNLSSAKCYNSCHINISSILMDSGGVSSIYKNPVKKACQDFNILFNNYGVFIGLVIYIKKISSKIPSYIKNLLIKKVIHENK